MLVCLQGGGVAVFNDGGVPNVNFESCSIFGNTASDAVRAHVQMLLSPCWSLHPHVLRVCLQGGGVDVFGASVALSNCQIYSNVAPEVRAHVRRFPSSYCDLLCDLSSRTPLSLPRWPMSMSAAKARSAPGQRPSPASVTQSHLARRPLHRRPRRRRPRPRRRRPRPHHRRPRPHCQLMSSLRRLRLSCRWRRLRLRRSHLPGRHLLPPLRHRRRRRRRWCRPRGRR